MLTGTALLVAAAVISNGLVASPQFQLAGRPSVFDYQKNTAASAASWFDAVIRGIDKRNGLVSILEIKGARALAAPLTLTFQSEDQADLMSHHVGDRIRMQVIRYNGFVKVRHIDVGTTETEAP